ncbi:MAG: glucokinase, partial [Planctomycetota bacterium]
MANDDLAGHDDLLLAGDIGGTNARFRVIAPGQLTTSLFEKSYDDCTVQHACERFVEEVGEAAKRIRTAGVGVAGRVVDGDVHLTNRPGETITNESIAEDLNLPADHVVVVNDMACHLSGIEHCDVADLRDGRPTGNVQGILMPGTGLGVGGRICVNDTWHPLPSEGGHLDFGSPHADYEPIRQSLLQQVGGTQL